MLTPNFIKAKDEILLRSLMFQVSLKLNGTVEFQITHNGKDFVAWYYDRPENIIAEKAPKAVNEKQRTR